jgi:aldehyde:ferredoxin oxidoreductase
LTDFGAVLDIDLSEEKVKTYRLPDDVIMKFLGGEGIASYIYWNSKILCSALSPENILIFATGPLTGIAPGAGRTVVAGKSPQSYPEAFTVSNFGGEWGTELRYAGFDILILRGKAEEPVYIWIHDGVVEISRAKHLWGLGSFKTREKLVQELNDEEVKIITIGPAGEKLVRYASIIHRSGHAAGQGGFGAVMGAKNVKAIAVRGVKRELKVYDPQALLTEAEKVKTLVRHLGIVAPSPVYKAYEELSTAPLTEDLIPLVKKYMKRNTGCHGCPKPCHVYIEIPEMDVKGEMACVQFFFCWLQQGYRGYADEVCFLAKHLADDLGLNVYELLQLIPFLMTLYTKGHIPKETATEIPFEKYPEKEFIEILLNKIAMREGLGNLLAEGTWRYAEKLGLLQQYLSLDDIEETLASFWGPVAGYGGYGPGARGYCNHYDPRDYIVSALLWATSHRDPWSSSHEYVAVAHWSGLEFEKQRKIAKYAWGSEEAVHPPGSPSYNEAEVRAAIVIQNRTCVKNSLILCDWLYPIVISSDASRDFIGDLELMARITNAIMGTKYSEQDLLLIGERIFNLERAILIREGVANITLPEHLFKYPQRFTGSPPLNRENFNRLLMTYFELRGWNSKGIPRREKLFQLDLIDIVKFFDEKEVLGK